jgi:hypothetical protein
MMSGPLFYRQVPLRRPMLGFTNWWDLDLPEFPELPEMPPPDPMMPPPAPVDAGAAEPGNGGAPAPAPAGNGGAPAPGANGGIPAANGGIMMPQMGPSMSPAFLFQTSRQPVQRQPVPGEVVEEVLPPKEASLTKDLAVTGLVALGVIAVISFAK